MLINEIDNYIANAMKAKDGTVETLKLIKAELVNEQKSGKPYDEALEAKILMKMVAQHVDSIVIFKNCGREDLAEKEEKEMEIIKTFIPEQPTDEEISEFTSAAISAYILTKEAGYKLSMKAMGPLMKIVKEKYPNANGNIVKKTLQTLI